MLLHKARSISIVIDIRHKSLVIAKALPFLMFHTKLASTETLTTNCRFGEEMYCIESLIKKKNRILISLRILFLLNFPNIYCISKR